MYPEDESDALQFRRQTSVLYYIAILFRKSGESFFSELQTDLTQHKEILILNDIEIG